MNKNEREKHPLEPFLPENAAILMLGSFPPKQEKWSMDFFYPNFINDMWRIIGYLFFDDKEHFIRRNDKGDKTREFDKEKIVSFCISKGIALFDAATEITRLKDNASDKYLEITASTDIEALLEKCPVCQAIVTTGQKATDTIASKYGLKEPKIGEWSEAEIAGRKIRFWRMPSTSRAYPLAIEGKVEFYKRMFIFENIL